MWLGVDGVKSHEEWRQEMNPTTNSKLSELEGDSSPVRPETISCYKRLRA